MKGMTSCRAEDPGRRPNIRVTRLGEGQHIHIGPIVCPDLSGHIPTLYVSHIISVNKNGQATSQGDRGQTPSALHVQGINDHGQVCTRHSGSRQSLAVGGNIESLAGPHWSRWPSGAAIKSSANR